jgi:hypothetical protein
VAPEGMGMEDRLEDRLGSSNPPLLSSQPLVHSHGDGPVRIQLRG